MDMATIMEYLYSFPFTVPIYAPDFIWLCFVIVQVFRNHVYMVKVKWNLGQ